MQQIFERGGTLEIAVARPGAIVSPTVDPMETAGSADLVWRLKIMALDEESILVEAPMALGATIRIEDGVALVGAITIGQNRWKFSSKKLSDEHPQGARAVCMRIEVPEKVERCLRRFVRLENQSPTPGSVKVWPLLDPRTVVAAELANEAAFRAFVEGKPIPSADAPRPEVGPGFTATLMNVGGGGVGLRVESADSAALGRYRIFWIELPIGLDQPVPIVATGKVVHTHLDSAQRTYIGVSFDFTFHMAHQAVVVEQIHRAMQSAQSQRESRT